MKPTDATTPPAAGSPEADPPPPAVDPAVAELQRERDDLRDRLLRTAAEFDNFRKRTERERRDLYETAAADLIRDLLPIADDLARALSALPVEGSAAGRADDAPLAALRSGVELIHRQFVDVLRRRGVEPLVVEGQPFDPNWHEAVVHEPAEGRPDGEIIGEVRRGYRLGQRLLRPAQVRVAKA